MTAWELAAQWHEDFCPEERLIEAVSRCIAGGFVHSSDDLFVLAWEAHWDDEQKQFTEGEHNAWVCKLAAGRDVIAGGMRIVPHRREWIVWQRNNDGRWRAHRWDKLEKYFSKN